MKYTIFGLSQKKLIEYGLDVSDALIIRWFVDFYSTEKMMKLTFEGKEYCWVSYKYLLECVPILNIKKQALHDRLKKIVICGVFENVCIKNHAGTFSGYRLSNKYENLISDCSELQTGVCSELQTGVCSELQTGVCSELQTKDSSIINNSSIKAINNIISASPESDKKNDFNESQIESYGKNNPTPKQTKFQVPSVEEIKAYCLERQNGIDAEYFFDYQSSRGWILKGQKTQMKDWKATVRTWEKFSTKTVDGKINDKLQKQLDAKKAREIPETEVWGNNFDEELTTFLENAKREKRIRDAEDARKTQ